MRYFSLGAIFYECHKINRLFVDKTAMIGRFLNDSRRIILITRPRRFGKTVNLSMLDAFFNEIYQESFRHLFDDLTIASMSTSDGESCMKHLHRYPVIAFTLKDIRVQTQEGMFEQLRELVSDIYDGFNYLLESPTMSPADIMRYQAIIQGTANDESFRASLAKLTFYLHRHHGVKPMVLIDEYDTPVHEAYSAKEPFHDDILDFMKVWLGKALKDNASLGKAVLTGILTLSLVNLFSGLNSIPSCTVLDHAYSEDFGFSQEECDSLLARNGLESMRSDLKHWYNGYQVGEQQIYNPWSVCRAITEHAIKRYWTGSGDHGVLSKAIITCQTPLLLDQMMELVQGHTIESDIDQRTLFTNLERNRKGVLGLMLFAGYLTAETADLAHGIPLKLRIPNHEVREDLRQMVADWIHYAPLDQTQGIATAEEESLTDSLKLALTNGNIDHFTDVLRSFMHEVVSYHDFHRHTEERFYHLFLLSMMLFMQEHFHIHSNKESGLGRYDILLAPKTPNGRGMIFELKSLTDASKLKDGASDALKQIASKHYQAFLKQYQVQETIGIGIAFAGKSLEVAYSVL